MDKKRKAVFLSLVGIFLLCPSLQLVYFIPLYLHLNIQPSQDFDLVVTYSDASSMRPALNLARPGNKPLFVSIAPWEHKPFRHRPAGQLKGVTIDTTSATTDQNARRAAAFIKMRGYKKIVLDVGWFHLPRALFLTRLYLLGTGVEVIPCAKTPLPDNWWANRLFYQELYKFWGSLGRVGLAFIGVETGPKGPPRLESEKDEN